MATDEDRWPLIVDAEALAADIDELMGRDLTPEYEAVRSGRVPVPEIPQMDGPPTVVLGSRISPEAYLQITKLAEARGMKTSALARQWLLDRLTVETGRAGHEPAVSRAQVLAEITRVIEQLPEAA